jgi:glutamate formiminotransferase
MQNRPTSNYIQTFIKQRQAVVEAVPNFSEGKNKKTIRSILKSIEGIKNVLVLDIHSDPSHNRTVITFIGTPEAVMQASFEAIKTAQRLIDLNAHKGEHPRIGATDVLPIVPIKGISTEDCINHVKNLGEKVSKELKIPVYLYEDAAQKEDRINLANIRKIGYEKLKEAIKIDPERLPDFGDKNLGTAGAIAIGVRDFLIAFNVNLRSSNLSIAKSIAQKTREKESYLEGVKAIGIDLKHKGIVQVSTNITRHKKVKIKEVFEKIKEEAEKRNIEIMESEIVGMVPKNSLPRNYNETLRLKNFESSRILPIK